MRIHFPFRAGRIGGHDFEKLAGRGVYRCLPRTGDIERNADFAACVERARSKTVCTSSADEKVDIAKLIA